MASLQSRSHFRCGPNRKKVALTLVAALAGGSMLSACQVRLKDAFVSGTTTYISLLLSPQVFLEAVLGDGDEAS